MVWPMVAIVVTVVVFAVGGYRLGRWVSQIDVDNARAAAFHANKRRLEAEGENARLRQGETAWLEDKFERS